VRSRATAAAVVVVAAVGSLIAAQDGGHRGTTTIDLPVAVARGREPVTGLVPEDFIVTDNGARQQVAKVAAGPLPLRVTVALDTSGGVGQRLASVVAAGYALTDALDRDDRIALMSFSHQVSLRVRMGPASDTFRQALGGLAADGGRSLHDAVNLALMTAEDGGDQHVVLLFSDGRDTTSVLTAAQAIGTAQRSRTILQIVGNRSDPTLQRLAEVTGGHLWPAGSDQQIKDSFVRALQDVRARYMVSYTLADPKPGWHEIHVALSRGRGDVTVRSGFVVR
jgi:VWFA-related protein